MLSLHPKNWRCEGEGGGGEEEKVHPEDPHYLKGHVGKKNIVHISGGQGGFRVRLD